MLNFNGKPPLTSFVSLFRRVTKPLQHKYEFFNTRKNKITKSCQRPNLTCKSACMIVVSVFFTLSRVQSGPSNNSNAK